jgi:Bax protein
MAAKTESQFARGTILFLGVLILALYVWAMVRLVGGPASEHSAAPPSGQPVKEQTQPRKEPAPQVAHRDAIREANRAKAMSEARPPQVERFASLPSDAATLNSVAERKHLFVKFMLPLVTRVNDEVLAKRGRLLELETRAAAGIALSPVERAWLDDLASAYGLERADFALLKARVDAVPMSLALAQAAEESGWGTSRFARHGNALFGQRAALEDGGMRPLDRGRDDGVVVRTFDGLQHSVRSYVHNLNTHNAYRKFRAQRVAMRDRHGYVDGFDLAGTLEKYSERGPDYVRTIRSIIARNGFRSLDRDGVPPDLAQLFKRI